MGCAQSRLRGRVAITQLEGTVQTGDLVLFSSKHAASHVTKCFTGSTWDHVGMVVKLSPKHVFILEYAGGVYLYPLFTRLYSYFAIQGREIVLRKLTLEEGRDKMQKQVENFIRGVLGKKPPPIEEIVMAVLKQPAVMRSMIDHMRGGSAEEGGKDDLSALFCSKLIAAVYKHVGLLPEDRNSGDYLPKHFASNYDSYLQLQQDAKLTLEVPINFDDVQKEIQELRERVAEENRMMPDPEQYVRTANKWYLSARDWSNDSLRRLSVNTMNTIGIALGQDKETELGGLQAAAPAEDDAAGDGNAETEAGGVPLRSGKIVEEVLNDNGGLYSPRANVPTENTTEMEEAKSTEEAATMQS